MRPRASQTADYALRAMLEITRAPAGARVTRGAIAERTNVHTSAMAQVLATLVRAQLLVAQPGPRGGYRLARPGSRISCRHPHCDRREPDSHPTRVYPPRPLLPIAKRRLLRVSRTLRKRRTRVLTITPEDEHSRDRPS
ncbi:MAG: Rrf2 family transcriptional regulator [Dehalococcoidia bacterium]|nr:Rrf2 family transcriptional regulator [Dehalococcoidia bacterium]